MDARALLHQLESLGITVAIDAGRLLVRPASALTEAHRLALRATKLEILALLADLGDSSRLEEFEERAAIMEFDGGLTRADAERAALELIRRVRHASAGRAA